MICLLLVMGGRAVAEEADAIVGEWYTEESKALVQIYKADDVYNGKIVWLKEPKNEDGSEKLDTNNPDEVQTGQPHHRLESGERVCLPGQEQVGRRDDL